MKNRIKRLLTIFSPVIDIIILPFILFSALLLKFTRVIGSNNFKVSKKILLSIGVFPIRDHYYEPLFNPKHLQKDLRADRDLPGIDWNSKEQIDLLNQFHYASELEKLNNRYTDELTFHFENTSFESGDAEYWYNIIRYKKPKRIIEIGSGNSTKMARLAIQKNVTEDSEYKCEHICIEPYEMPWLEKLGISIIRNKVENIPVDFFKKLENDDILFIDSSHMIRPQGDVLFEYLQLLPTLNKGVIVHVHDIFSPKDYPNEWILKDVVFWNEQYLFEAFLTHNSSWKVLGALNYLHHNYYDTLKEKCPRLTPAREPGSFYIVKT